MTATTTRFPIDLGAYKPLTLDPASKTLTAEQRETLKANIQLCRDAIIFFTATGAAHGVGGHTGGPYDTVPEVMILDALFRSAPDQFVPIFFDEAGHRVATQYLMATLHGDLPAEQLTHYREANSHLPGHPELGLTPGVKFSSGRLGHMWPYVNGVALANPGKTVFCLGSDGSQQEGNDAEAARLAVAQHLNVKLIIDDNDVTIAGHPSKYLPGFTVAKTLAGHGLKVLEGNGEDLDDLYARIVEAVTTPGPIAVVNKRPMSVGIEGLEGSTHGHDVISVKLAIAYLEKRGLTAAVDFLKAIETPKNPYKFIGVGDTWDSNRNVFGDAVNSVLDGMSEADRKANVIVIDSDLEGSCGLKKSTMPTLKSSFLPASWSAATSPLRLALGWKKASRASSPRSLPSWKCASPKSRWHGSTTPTCSVTSPTPASTTWQTTPVTSVSTTFLPIMDWMMATKPASTSLPMRDK